MSNVNYSSLAENIIFNKNFRAAKWAIFNLNEKQKKNFAKFCNNETLYESHPFEKKYDLDIMDNGLEGDTYCMYFLDNQDEFLDFSDFPALQKLICGK